MGSKILIVDDEQALRDNLTRFFIRKGFEAVEAGSGNQALQILKDQEVSLIISDMRMADGDGLYLYQETRKLTSAPAFIFLTGFSEISEDKLRKMPGVLSVENKPIEKKVLLERVKNYFD